MGSAQRWEEGRTKEAARNYETYLAEYADRMSLDDHFLDHLAATNVKLNFVRLNDEGVVQYYVPPSEGKLLSDNWMDLTLSGNETDEFDTEKSVALLSRIIGWATRGDDLVLDFFAGSGTTGHAVLAVNAADGGQRRFILVQLPEKVARKEGTSIAAITRSRVRRAAEVHSAPGADTGLRAFRVDSTNLMDTFAAADGLVQGDLLGGIDSVKSDRTDEDLLFQVLLDWGLDVAESITVEEVDARRVLSVADGALVACFANEVTEIIVNEIASRRPIRAVFLDSGFATDAARINAEQIFREVSPETEVRAI